MVVPPRLGLRRSSIPRLAPGDCVWGWLGVVGGEVSGGVRVALPALSPALRGTGPPRCLPLCGGPASGRCAIRAEGVA